MYATAIYAVIDSTSGTMRLSSAGHPLPLRVGQSGDAVSPALDTTMCLLWRAIEDVPCIEIPLQNGERWAFFTDGITDRQSADGTMFDLERLSSALARHRHGAAAEIVSSIVCELERFAAGQEPEDDQTLLVVGIDDPTGR
jgi:serine phosphatase RsbU (regulator of sigma subunit)